MAQVMRPLEYETIRSLPGLDSACGGAQLYAFHHEETTFRQRYYDSEYKAKAELGIPKLLMPYQAYRNVYSSTYGKHTTNHQWWIRACYGPPQTSATESLLKERSEHLATTRLFNKLNSEDDFNLGVALAEMRETIGLLASTAIRINRGISSLRKGKVDDCFRILGLKDRFAIRHSRYAQVHVKTLYKNVGEHRISLKRVWKTGRFTPNQFAANSWLELTYGWGPLLYDVYGSAAYVAKLLHDTDVDLTLSAVDRVRGEYPDHSHSAVWQGGECDVKSGWIVHLKVDDPLLRNQEALGLTNLKNVLWEKVPFSFVYDWFHPVGPYLESLTALQGYTVVQKAYTVKLHRVVTYQTLNLQKSQAKCTNVFQEIQRVTNKTLVPSTPKFNLFKKLGASRATTAVALLAQQFSRR